MIIKIVPSLYAYLRDNHAGQHCPKYAVLSRIVQAQRNGLKIMAISKHEADSIPDEYLIAVDMNRSTQ
jgi:hypothetical protein